MTAEVAAAPAELNEPRTEGTMVVDVEWQEWSPEQVALFLKSVGGFCTEHADKFVTAQCSGGDLEKLDLDMLQGIGVENGWHRYRILDAVQVMKETAAEELLTLQAAAKGKKTYSRWDRNKDSSVDKDDFIYAAKKFAKEFKAFAFSENIQSLVVGLMVGAGLKDVASSLATDILTPLLLAGWTKNLENLFVVIQDGDTADATYETVEEAAADGASTLNYGKFIQTLVDFLVMALFVYIFFRILNNMRLKAKEELAGMKMEYKAWEKKNKGSHAKAGVVAKLEFTSK